MKSLLVARKYLMEIWREPMLLVLTILAPAAMMLVMAFGYGQNPRLATYRVLVDDRSGGLARDDLQALEEQRYPDGRPVFHLSPQADPQLADELLRAKKAVVYLAFSRDESGNLVRTVKGDGTSMAFITASGIVEQVLLPVQERREGLHPILSVDTADVSLHMPQTDFDAYAPGVMIMAVLLLIPQTAMLIGRELRTGTIHLLHMSPLRTVEWFAGISLAQLVSAFLQVLLMLIMAKCLGFQTRGSMPLAVLICLVLSFSSIGLGLLVAGFIHNDSEAINTGSVFSMLQVFLCGAFFPFDAGVLLNINGHQLGIFDVIPATQGMMILRQSLVSGADFGSIVFRLLLMAGLSILIFALGIINFNRRFNRR
ncbi:MAG: ABC transporter permease [Leptolinea sp.]|jgi:ABC-type polysaccharide/polyol phosphate export permease|nr:ABC transporter permease [Leptolinea sp.]